MKQFTAFIENYTAPGVLTGKILDEIFYSFYKLNKTRQSHYGVSVTYELVAPRIHELSRYQFNRALRNLAQSKVIVKQRTNIYTLDKGIAALVFSVFDKIFDKTEKTKVPRHAFYPKVALDCKNNCSAFVFAVISGFANADGRNSNKKINKPAVLSRAFIRGLLENAFTDKEIRTAIEKLKKHEYIRKVDRGVSRFKNRSAYVVMLKGTTLVNGDRKQCTKGQQDPAEQCARGQTEQLPQCTKGQHIVYNSIISSKENIMQAVGEKPAALGRVEQKGTKMSRSRIKSYVHDTDKKKKKSYLAPKTCVAPVPEYESDLEFKLFLKELIDVWNSFPAFVSYTSGLTRSALSMLHAFYKTEDFKTYWRDVILAASQNDFWTGKVRSGGAPGYAASLSQFIHHIYPKTIDEVKHSAKQPKREKLTFDNKIKLDCKIEAPKKNNRTKLGQF